MDEKTVKRLWRKYQNYAVARTAKNAKALYNAFIALRLDPAAMPLIDGMTYIEFVTAIQMGMTNKLEEEETKNVDEGHYDAAC